MYEGIAAANTAVAVDRLAAPAITKGSLAEVRAYAKGKRSQEEPAPVIVHLDIIAANGRRIPGVRELPSLPRA
jgi:hypothetical protein